MAAPSISKRGAQGHWGQCTSTSSLLSTELPLLSLGSLDIFCCLFSFRGTKSPFSRPWSGLLFFRLGMANRPGLVGGGGAGISGGYVLRASLELPPLFLLANSPLSLGLFFWSICSSSSSNSESILVIIKCLGWTEDILTDSVSKSDICTGISDGPTSSTKPNWSISSSKRAEKMPFPLPLQWAFQGGLVAKELRVGEGIVGRVVWREEDFREPRSLAWIRQYGVSWDLLPWWRGLSPKRLLKWAQNPRLDGRLVVDDLRLQKFLTRADNLNPLC